MFPNAGQQFGRYRIVRLLARGGMGVVYEAHDPNLDRSVALKVLLPTLSDREEFRERFNREAGILARIRSRHIVTVLDHGSSGDVVYLVTDFFPDGDLHTWLEAHGPLSVSTALRLTAHVCEALDDAHTAGVLHRDVKPSNILLWRRGDGLVPYLCDFGIAADGTGAATRTGAVIGSLGYLAPERHLGRPAVTQSDIYSLGCTLWTCLTGTPPYSSDSDLQLISAHLQSPVRQVAARSPAESDLNDLLAALMAKSPDDRLATAAGAGAACAALAMRVEAELGTTHRAEPVEQDQSGHGFPFLTNAAPPAEPTVQGPSLSSPWTASGSSQAPAPRSTSVPPTTPEVPARVAQSQPSAGRRLPLLVGILVVALAGLGGVLAGILADLDDAPPRTAADPAGTRELSTSAPVASAPTTAADPSARPDQVPCWDGTTATSIGDCPELDGSPRAFAVVFPGFEQARQDGRCDRSVADNVRVYYECDDVRFATGTVRVSYSRWNTHYRGFKSYSSRRNARAAWRDSDYRYLWWMNHPDGSEFKIAAHYKDERLPWSVTVAGGTQAIVQRALALYGQMQGVNKLLGNA